MKRSIRVLAVLLVTSLAWAETAKEKVNERLQDAAEVLQAIINAPDQGIPAR